MSAPASQPPVDQLRPHAEHAFAAELAALATTDDRPRPPRWRLSPWAVVHYLLGGPLPDGSMIIPKYVGSRRLVEVAVATLATDRALLLLGVPGTAKSWLSEHLSAAISGNSTLLVQGTAGTAEEAIRYGWNYARLIAEGPSEQALVPSPVMTAMRQGAIARIEELTRIPADVQDALITILSEKTLPIPELGEEAQALKGFNVIATANDRDKGVNELSSALRRRFNTVIMPLPASEEDEVAIVSSRVAERRRGVGVPRLMGVEELLLARAELGGQLPHGRRAPEVGREPVGGLVEPLGRAPGCRAGRGRSRSGRAGGGAARRGSSGPRTTRRRCRGRARSGRSP